jgi:hypothetical protein
MQKTNFKNLDARMNGLLERRIFFRSGNPSERDFGADAPHLPVPGGA